MTSKSTMKTLSERTVNRKDDASSLRRLEEGQVRQQLRQLRQGGSIVEGHLAGLMIPNNSSKTVTATTTSTTTEMDKQYISLKKIIRERMYDGEEDTGGNKMTFDDHEENGKKPDNMYAPVTLTDIATPDMESAKTGKEIFDFENGQKHRGGGRSDDQTKEKNIVSPGFVWMNELPMDLTAWDWYPSLEGLRKGTEFGESPICVTEIDQFNEYDRTFKLRAPSSMGRQESSGTSVGIADDRDQDDISDFFEDDFKPSTLQDPLPSLKTADGSTGTLGTDCNVWFLYEGMYMLLFNLNGSSLSFFCLFAVFFSSLLKYLGCQQCDLAERKRCRRCVHDI